MTHSHNTSLNIKKTPIVHPKSKRKPPNTTDVVYSKPCQNYDKVYVGETGRKLGLRVDKHKLETVEAVTAIRTHGSPVGCQQSATTDHVVDTVSTTSVEKED